MVEHTQNVLATQVTVGAIIAYATNWLKNSKYFPWITHETQVISHFVAAFLSAAAAVGVNAVWNGTEHTLVISGLTLTGILGAVWALGKQFAIQHLAGQVMYPPSAQPPAQAPPQNP
jgi:hypothetical protein